MPAAPVMDAIDGDVCRITLAVPERHNSLDLPLLSALEQAIGRAREAAGAGTVRAVVLGAEGRSFSTGGDLTAFLAHSDTPADLRAYAQELVGTLNRVILALLDLPVPLIAVVPGAVTGGAAGLMLAADRVAASGTAFLQPYYGEVGFAPDGGWTALLPLRIGPQKTLAALQCNDRFDSETLQALGLADWVGPRDGLQEPVRAWLAGIRAQSPATLATARALVWDRARIDHVATRLEAERQAFLAHIADPAVIAAMRRFVSSLKAGRP
ncbi:enoyl-CoA hydratase/isomerase family protein [Yunchengibacter salinarum]|uniref:enoyl-CoA hydratase/isomerase family protein n=1 Tax=Yunchengibacter salinarum TaxID=3133399 RepID=UPI0035B6826E